MDSSRPTPPSGKTKLLKPLTINPVRSYGMFNCCGFGKNISRFGRPEVYCLDPSITAVGGSHG